MSEQPEALRLAEKLNGYNLRSGYAQHCHKAARLLREQHAEIENLISRNQGLAMQNSLLRGTVEAMKRTAAAWAEKAAQRAIDEIRRVTP